MLLVLSVGYALFSETITINGTATAKGSFDTTVEVCDLNENNEKSNCSDRFYNGDVSSNVPLVSEIIGGMTKDGTFYRWGDAGFENNFEDATYGMVLEPGESLFHTIGFYWSSNYDNDENSSSYSLDVSTELRFIQTTN